MNNNEMYLIPKNLLYWKLLLNGKSIIEKYNIQTKDLLDVFFKKRKLIKKVIN